MNLRRYLIAGLLVWIPLVVTIFAIRFLIDIMDGTLALLPKAYQPETLFGAHIPGLGLLFTLLVLIFTGVFVRHFLGHKLVTFWESILSRIPLVRSIYNGAKQVVETLLTSGGQSFRKVFLVQYPRKGLWALAFQTGTASSELQKHIEPNTIALFLPTTPNPTSGFLIIVPKKDVIELGMSVDDALKMIISLGVVQPET